MERFYRVHTPLIAAAMGSDGDLVVSRFERGCECFGIWIDGAIGAYGWLSTGPEWIGEIQLEIKPREREAYIWNCVTVEAHRRKGMFRSMVQGLSIAARRLGNKRAWIGSMAIPAEKTLEPLGFQAALRFDYVTLAGLHIMRVSSALDRALATDAASVVGVSPGLVIRGSHLRRH